MRRALKAIAVIWPALGWAGSDLGVQGRVWGIEEPDMRAVLIEQANEVAESGRINLDAEKTLDRMKFPEYTLHRTEATALRRIDISQVLDRDIWAPIQQPDGSLKETLVAVKGTRLNPLDHVQPTTGFLIVDGADEDQVKLMRDILEWTADFRPVLSRGRPDKVADGLGQPVFFLRPEMEARFQLRHTPSVVWAGRDADRGYLMVMELQPADFRVEAISGHYTPILKGMGATLERMIEIKEAVDAP